MLEALRTSPLSTFPGVRTSLMFVPSVGKSVGIYIMPKTTWRPNISPPRLGITVNCVERITNPRAHSQATCHLFIGINEKRTLTVPLLSGGSLEEQAFLYIERNEDRTCSCSICGKVSRDLFAAKAHYEAIHFSSGTRYNCQICLKTYKTKGSLAVHMTNQHRNK